MRNILGVLGVSAPDDASSHQLLDIFEKEGNALGEARAHNDLGVVYTNLGEFDKALVVYKECLATCEDDDSKLAVGNWLYITLRRLGKKADALKVLKGISSGMEVVENQSYYSLLYLYQGTKSEAEVEKEATSSALELATLGYGIGAWYLYNCKTEKAKEVFEKIVNTSYWPAFGYISAEAELVRMKK